MQIKVRVIARQTLKNNEPILGFTLPKEYALFTKPNTFYYIERSGTSFILTSGTSNIPTQQQIENYKFKEVQI